MGLAPTPGEVGYSQFLLFPKSSSSMGVSNTKITESLCLTLAAVYSGVASQRRVGRIVRLARALCRGGETWLLCEL